VQSRRRARQHKIYKRCASVQPTEVREGPAAAMLPTVWPAARRRRCAVRFLTACARVWGMEFACCDADCSSTASRCMMLQCSTATDARRPSPSPRHALVGGSRLARSPAHIARCQLRLLDINPTAHHVGHLLRWHVAAALLLRALCARLPPGWQTSDVDAARPAGPPSIARCYTGAEPRFHPSTLCYVFALLPASQHSRCQTSCQRGSQCGRSSTSRWPEIARAALGWPAGLRRCFSRGRNARRDAANSSPAARARWRYTAAARSSWRCRQ
jgi:hypothetical protein